MTVGGLVVVGRALRGLRGRTVCIFPLLMLLDRVAFGRPGAPCELTAALLQRHLFSKFPSRPSVMNDMCSPIHPVKFVPVRPYPTP